MTVKFDVEPSQIDWITRHQTVVPVYFLVAVGEYWFLIHGKHIQEIAQRITMQRLFEIARQVSHQEDAREQLSGTLASITRRTRNELPGV